jgi:hypothetical protein
MKLEHLYQIPHWTPSISGFGGGGWCGWGRDGLDTASDPKPKKIKSELSRFAPRKPKFPDSRGCTSANLIHFPVGAKEVSGAPSFPFPPPCAAADPSLGGPPHSIQIGRNMRCPTVSVSLAGTRESPTNRLESSSSRTPLRIFELPMKKIPLD